MTTSERGQPVRAYPTTHIPGPTVRAPITDEWILAHRGPRNPVDPKRPYHFLLEQERAASGEIVSVATIFLTNRECPWRCLMCDLWKNTLTHSVSPGDIPAQIEFALAQLGAARHVKLYNSGSFFDAAAIPPSDHAPIAQLLSGFDRVIVECHPALIGQRVLPFQQMLKGKLEIALGLETIHPEALPRLNKRMTLEMFSEAAHFLHKYAIDLRAFVLLKPPFMGSTGDSPVPSGDPPDGMAEVHAVLWTQRSLEFAFDCQATAVSIIPVRPGNGALESLGFSPPKLESLEASLANGIRSRRGRVFADLWDLQQFSHCPACFELRRDRLARMNLSQAIEPPIDCPKCQTTST